MPGRANSYRLNLHAGIIFAYHISSLNLNTTKMLSIKFDFRAREYCALVRMKEREAKIEYHITIMNGELERLLYGNHVLVPESGLFKSELSPDTDVGRLKCIIAEALNKQIALESGPEASQPQKV